MVLSWDLWALRYIIVDSLAKEPLFKEPHSPLSHDKKLPLAESDSVSQRRRSTQAPSTLASPAAQVSPEQIVIPGAFSPPTGGSPAQAHYRLKRTNTIILYNLLDFSTTTMLSAYAREEVKVQNAVRVYNAGFYTNQHTVAIKSSTKPSCI